MIAPPQYKGRTVCGFVGVMDHVDCAASCEAQGNHNQDECMNYQFCDYAATMPDRHNACFLNDGRIIPEMDGTAIADPHCTTYYKMS